MASESGIVLANKKDTKTVELEDEIIAYLEDRGLKWFGKPGMRPWLHARRYEQMRYDAFKTVWVSIMDDNKKLAELDIDEDWLADLKDEFFADLERFDEDHMSFMVEAGLDANSWTESDEREAQRAKLKRLREPKDLPRKAVDENGRTHYSVLWQDYQEWSEDEDNKHWKMIEEEERKQKEEEEEGGDEEEKEEKGEEPAKKRARSDEDDDDDWKE